MMEVGLEVFLKKEYRKFRKMKLGVLCNQASVDKSLKHISELVTQKKFGLNVVSFFGPQHGIRGEKQDNMVESDDFHDPVTGKPVYSLYGKFREPTDASVQELDAFLIDLQDVGTRIYTFMYTMANCMRAAQKFGKKVIVLDRPNPIGGVRVEGNLLESGFTSFVGQFPLCTRHGMTMGELALLFNEAFEIRCDLEIVHLKGWKRKMTALDWGRAWIPPSPNIPCYESALVFPGTVAFEGTNVSEGRGTTKPFEWIGAPFINPDILAKAMNRMKLPGVYFRPIFFQPTYQKGKDQVCGGVHIHVTDERRFNSFIAGTRLLVEIAELFPNGFQWKPPPYEYEHERMPIDLIAGTARLRAVVGAQAGTKGFENTVKKDVVGFLKLRKDYLLYR